MDFLRLYTEFYNIDEVLGTHTGRFKASVPNYTTAYRPPLRSCGHDSYPCGEVMLGEPQVCKLEEIW